MTQEEKDLLLKDLCARLPYGTKCYNRNTEEVFTLSEATDTTDSSNVSFDYGYCDINYIQPYLRPMSSMTDGEKIVLELYNAFTEFRSMQLKFDWLNEHHFDYRGLIDIGLALEAPEGMYN